MVRILTVILVVLTLAGCAVVSSRDVSDFFDADDRAEGVFYSLPKGVVPFELGVKPKEAIFQITAKAIEYIPDNRKQYFMRYKPSPSSHDVVKVFLTTPNSFLEKIESSSEDQTDHIILNVVKALASVPKLQFASIDKLGDDSSVLETIAIDPTIVAQRAELCERFSQKVISFSRGMAGTTGVCWKNSNKDYSKVDKEACAEYSRIVGVFGNKLGNLKYHCRQMAEHPQNISLNGAPIYVALDSPDHIILPKSAKCEVGACYRPVLSHNLTVGVVGGSSASTRIELPNAAPLIELDVSRAMFVKKVTDINFDPATGLLTSVEIKKPSQLVEAAKLPVEIAKLLISAPTDILKLKYANVSKQSELTQKRIDIAKAKGQAQGAAGISDPKALLNMSETASPSDVLLRASNFIAVFKTPVEKVAAETQNAAVVDKDDSGNDTGLGPD